MSLDNKWSEKNSCAILRHYTPNEVKKKHMQFYIVIAGIGPYGYRLWLLPVTVK